MSGNKRRLTLSKLPADQRSSEPLLKGARPDIEIHRDVLRLVAESRFCELPREIEVWLDAVAESCVDVYWPASSKGRRLVRLEVARMMRSAVREGYLAAMMEYGAEIQQSHEASVEYDKREQAGNKGRQKQAHKKSDRSARIQSLLAQGIEPKDIARAIPCSLATVYRALTPAISKPAKRLRSARHR